MLFEFTVIFSRATLRNHMSAWFLLTSYIAVFLFHFFCFYFMLMLAIIGYNFEFVFLFAPNLFPLHRHILSFTFCCLIMCFICISSSSSRSFLKELEEFPGILTSWRDVNFFCPSLFYIEKYSDWLSPGFIRLVFLWQNVVNSLKYYGWILFLS